MSFVLRFGLLFLALISSYIGSLSFDSSSGVDMFVGAVALLIAILCFFFLGKGLWRFLGCFSTFILMVLLVGLIFFVFSGNAAKILNFALDKFGPETPAPTAPPPQAGYQQQVQQVMAQENGMPQEQAAPQPPAPQGPPVFSGQVESIVSGDVFRMGGQTVRLFGLATPLINQTCADAHGRSYDCGYIAARKLKEFVNNDEVVCKVMNVNPLGELIAPCSVGAFDIGAAMVEEGWAIALPSISPVYVPYEAKAKENKSGMWGGTFQTPWEWVADQKRVQEEKSKIKVDIPKPKKKKKSIFDAF